MAPGDRRQGRHRRDGHRRVRAPRRSSSSGSSSSAPTRSRRCRPFRPSFDSFHAHTAPSDWYEGLIKAYVGDGLAADFYREIAAYLDAGDPRGHHQLARGHGHSRRSSSSGSAPGIAEDHRLGGRLALWGRRLMGEALTQAQRVAARAGRPHRAAGRRSRPPGPRPGRAGPDVHPADRAPHRADGRARPRGLSRHRRRRPRRTRPRIRSDAGPRAVGACGSDPRAGPGVAAGDRRGDHDQDGRGQDRDDASGPSRCRSTPSPPKSRVDASSRAGRRRCRTAIVSQMRDVVLVARCDELAEQADDRADDDEDDEIQT